MIKKLSKDFGASLYIDRDGKSPDFEALESDGRIREVYDRNDWTPGDYTYSEVDRCLFLTGTGEVLWQWVDENN